VRETRQEIRPGVNEAALPREGSNVWIAEDQAADLGWSDDAVGKAGAMYENKEVSLPERTSTVEIITGSPEEAAITLVEKLRKEAKVI
jgi:electron transfer flavoprotein alpha/beta subunit